MRPLTGHAKAKLASWQENLCPDGARMFHATSSSATIISSQCWNIGTWPESWSRHIEWSSLQLWRTEQGGMQWVSILCTTIFFLSSSSAEEKKRLGDETKTFSCKYCLFSSKTSSTTSSLMLNSTYTSMGRRRGRTYQVWPIWVWTTSWRHPFCGFPASTCVSGPWSFTGKLTIKKKKTASIGIRKTPCGCAAHTLCCRTECTFIHRCCRMKNRRSPPHTLSSIYEKESFLFFFLPVRDLPAKLLIVYKVKALPLCSLLTQWRLMRKNDRKKSFLEGRSRNVAEEAWRSRRSEDMHYMGETNYEKVASENEILRRLKP